MENIVFSYSEIIFTLLRDGNITPICLGASLVYKRVNEQEVVFLHY